MYVSALEVNFTQTPPPSPANNASRSTIAGTIVASTTRPTQPINIVAATKQRRRPTTTTTKTMKMEVLARNQFQAQFDGIGSTKATDWTKPLTPPTSAIHQQQHHQHHHHQQQQQQQQQQLPTPPHQQDYHRQQQQQQPHHDLASPQQPTSDGYHNNNNNNNNNHNDTHHHHHPDDSAVGELSLRLQAELRAAKSRNLACTEVLLPMDLLDRIATDMVQMAEKEPCGIRGCSVFVEFEDEPGNSRRIASLQVGAGTVATFELYLTLRHDQSGWTAKLPQFLKNLARRSTIIISPEYTLIKNKLYNSFLE